jgi:uncharacterized membrane protein
MPQISFAGHPLHAQLIVAPAGILPFSSIMDLMWTLTGREHYATTAYHSLIAGSISAIAAGIAGAIDYSAIPSKTKTKRTANVHVLLNAAVFGLYGTSLMLRRKRRSRPARKLASALSLIGGSTLLVSAWYGAHLVYHHGMRVEGISPIESAENLRLPSDAAIDRGLQKAEEAVPNSGPAA